MKDKILSFAGMGIKGRSSSDPLITHLSPTNHPLLQKAWKYTTCMILALLLGVGNMWAEYDVLFNGYSSTTKNDYYKNYTIGTKTVTIGTSGSISSSSGDYFVQLGSAASDASSNYISVAANEFIDSVSFLMTGNGADKDLIPALLCWGTAYNNANKTYADSAIVHAKQRVSAKGLTNAQWVDFDLSESSFKEVRVYKQVKNIVVKTATKANFPADGAQTLQVYGVRIKLRPAGFSITYEENGHGANQTDLTAQTALPATLPTLSEAGWIFGGWFTNSDLADGHEAVAGASISENTTLYAKWTEDASPTHAITYNSESLKGADVSGYPTEYYEGTGIASFEPLADVKDWHFNGWNPPSIGADATTNIVVYATWVKAYDVTFSAGAGDGTVPATFQKWEGAKFELPGQGSMVAPSGKAFDGWKAGTTKYAAGAEYTMGNAAVSFVAQWKNAPTTVFYYQWSGSGTAPTANTALTATGGTFTFYKSESSTKDFKVADVTYNAAIPADMKTEAGTSDKLVSLNSTTNNSYLVTLTGDKYFEEGDTVYFAGYGNFKVGSTHKADDIVAATSALETGSGASDVNVGYFLFPAVENVNTLYFTRHEDGNNRGFTAVKVIRPAQKEVKSTVYDLTAVKINGTAISATNLATLKTGNAYLLDLADEYAVAPVVKFARQTTTTYEDDSQKVANDTITVTASEVSSKWQAQGTIGTITYTVKAAKVSAVKLAYYDGSTKLGEETVGVGGNPAKYADYQDKDFATFVGWYSDADLADGHKIADIAALIVTKDTTLYGKWTPAYASSFNIEQWVLTNGAGKGATTKTSALLAEMGTKNYLSNIAWENKNNELDTLDDSKTDGKRNYAYLGLKVKKDASNVRLLLQDGKSLKVKFGNVAATPNIKIGEAEATAMTITEGVYSLDAASGDRQITITTTSAGAVVFKQIMIDEAIAEVKLPANVTIDANGGTFTGETVLKYTGTPLVIGDATPADAENYLFDGWYDGETKIDAAAYEPARNVTLVAKYVLKPSPFSLTELTYQVGSGAVTPVGYVEGTYTYSIELPYAKSYDAITVVATLKETTSNIKGGAISQPSGVPGVATFTVVNTLDANEQTYTVNFKKGAKDGVEIIRATHTGAKTANVTGTIGGEADKNTEGEGKLGDADNFFGIKLAKGTFQSGDILKIHATKSSAAVRIYSDKGTNRINAEDGVFEEGLFTYTLTSATEWIYLYRITKEGETDMNPTVDYMAVYRPMDPVLTAIKFNDTEVAVTGTTVAATLPHGTTLGTMTVDPTIAWNGAGTAEVTGSWAWGANTFTVTDKDGDATVYTITLTEDVEKFTVTYYDGSTELGTEQVEVNGHPTAAEIIAPKKLGKTFQGWSESDGGDVVALNTITRTEAGTVKLYAVYEDIVCPTSGTVYKFEIKDGLASENLPIATDMDMSSYIDATGIGLLTYSATENNKATINSDGTIQLKDATAAYLKVELACALAAGDQIRAHVSNNPIRVQVGTTYDSSKDLILDKNAYDIVDITAAMEGLKVLYIARSTNGNANLADFEIYRRPALTGVSLSNFTMRAGATVTPTMTLSPTADAIVTSQVWSIVSGEDKISINTSTGAVTAGSSEGDAVIKVVLNNDETNFSATATVRVVAAFPRVDVSESTEWDWDNAVAAENTSAVPSSGAKITALSPEEEYVVLANVDNISNGTAFNSQALEGKVGQMAWRSTTYKAFQGSGEAMLKFHVGDNEGAVRLLVSSSNSKTDTEIRINEYSKVFQTTSSDRARAISTDWVKVGANSDVVIDAGSQSLRIYKIEFLTLEQRRTYSWIKPGELGTVCLKNDAVAVGADIYELQGPNEYGKLVFDQIEDNKIEAGKPYVFSATATGEISFYTQVNADHTENAGNTKGMYGTFSDKTFDPSTDQNIYYFSGHAIYGVKNWSSTATVTIPAYLCYLNMVEFKASPAPSANPAPGRRRIVFDVQGEQVATGIGNVQGDEVQSSKVLINGQLFILRGEKMYDATGRLVK